MSDHCLQRDADSVTIRTILFKLQDEEVKSTFILCSFSRQYEHIPELGKGTSESNACSQRGNKNIKTGTAPVDEGAGQVLESPIWGKKIKELIPIIDETAVILFICRFQLFRSFIRLRYAAAASCDDVCTSSLERN